MNKTLLSTVVFAIAMLVAAAAEPEMRVSSKKVREEVRMVVGAQLAALRAGDFPDAYEYAASGIKARFDQEVFAAMIRRGYPGLLVAATAQLGLVRDRNGELAEVTVSVVDRQKRTVVYLYHLVWEEGRWRISGVTLEPKPSRGDV